MRQLTASAFSMDFSWPSAVRKLGVWGKVKNIYGSLLW